LDLSNPADVVGHAEDLGPVVHEALLERGAIAVVYMNSDQMAFGEKASKDSRKDHAINAA